MSAFLQDRLTLLACHDVFVHSPHLKVGEQLVAHSPAISCSPAPCPLVQYSGGDEMLRLGSHLGTVLSVQHYRFSLARRTC